MVEVLDGCGVNRNRVLGSAAISLARSVLVTDDASGVTLAYRRNARTR